MQNGQFNNAFVVHRLHLGLPEFVERLVFGAMGNQVEIVIAELNHVGRIGVFAQEAAKLADDAIVDDLLVVADRKEDPGTVTDFSELGQNVRNRFTCRNEFGSFQDLIG